MSQTTEAKLFFGFTFDLSSMDKATQEMLTGSKWHTWGKTYTAKKGLAEPPYTAETINEWRAYDAQRQELVKGLEIDRYHTDSDDDEVVWYVCAKEHSVYMDGAEALDSKQLWVRKDLVALLKDFCGTMGVPWKAPQWHLVCYREH